MADTETRIAFAYATLKNDGNFLSRLGEILEKENVSRIVIGRPGYFKQDQKEDRGQTFEAMIKGKFPHLGIEFQNEMFTTRSAQDNLIAKGLKNVGQQDDAEAARIILQEFLDKA